MPLTQADGSQEAQAGLRGEAGREERLQHVVGEGEGDDSLVGGVDHQHSNPQPQEPKGRTAKSLAARAASQGHQKSGKGQGWGDVLSKWANTSGLKAYFSFCFYRY